jgi:hypothetical protein
MRKGILIVLLFTAGWVLAQGKSAPKPYGCYRDLRWGMTPEAASKSLGLELSSNPHCSGEGLCPVGPVEIGAEKYRLDLHFSPEGLSQVSLHPWGETNRALDTKALCNKNAERRMADYIVMNEGLTKKFGKPGQELKENKGDDVNLASALCSRQARWLSQWITAESKIELKVELEAIMPIGGKYLYLWEIFLNYTKLQKAPDAAKDLQYRAGRAVGKLS